LRENFSEKAVFRLIQEDVIKAIMRGDTVVTYIASTGAGKSLAFLLPYCYRDYRQSIVIVPLAALRQDIATHCKALYIRASI